MSEKYRELPQKFTRIEQQFTFQPDYPNDILVSYLKNLVAETTGIPLDNIPNLSEPPRQVNADFGLPTFPLAKVLRQNPVAIAQNLAQRLSNEGLPFVKSVRAEGGYLNLDLNYDSYGKAVLDQVLTSKDSYGSENIGNGEVVVIDMSSPNIAKPMSVGHLRSTVIGHSTARLKEFTGHKVIKDNHLGDWGAQFGMLLKAYELWGDETPELQQEGKEVEGLLKLYVKIHDEVDSVKRQEIERLKELVKEKGFSAIEGLEEAYQRAFADSGSEEQALEDALSKFTPETGLERAGREWFRRLERGDEEAKKQWEWVVNLSMKEFQAVYQLLGVDFDYALGESFYSEMLPEVVEQVRQQSFVIEEKGAVVAHLEDKKLGKMVIQTGDGRSLYVTRDLATAIFRAEQLNADQILYVVGADQKHYFSQWFEILRRMGYQVADKCRHIYFGMITLPEGRMSTRKGRVVFLKDVIDQGIQRAEEVIRNKNPELSKDDTKRKEIARQVAVGAIIWSDIGEDMKRDITFEWDKMLSFDGYSAPYVQYAHARATSILRKAYKKGMLPSAESDASVTHELEKDLIKKMANFPTVVKRTALENNPATIAEYVYSLAQSFNQFYRECSVLKETNEDVRNTRLQIVTATSQVIRNALYLLGIESPEEM